MAKIYETREDVERDRLAEEADGLRSATSTLWSTGLLSMLAGSLMLDKKSLNVKLGNTKTGWDKFSNGFDRIGGWVMLGVGGFSAISSFFTASGAQKTEDVLKKLGPQEVTLPEGALPTDLEGMKTHGGHAAIIHKEREQGAFPQSVFK